MSPRGLTAAARKRQKLGGQSQSPAKRSASAQNGRKLKERAERSERKLELVRALIAQNRSTAVDFVFYNTLAQIVGPAADGGAR